MNIVMYIEITLETLLGSFPKAFLFMFSNFHHLYLSEILPIRLLKCLFLIISRSPSILITLEYTILFH